MGFNGRNGKITLTTGLAGDPNHSKEVITKFSGIILDHYINSIGGGDIDKNTIVTSTVGYGNGLAYTVSNWATTKQAGVFKKTLIKKYENVKWDSNSPLKSEIRARHQRHILIALVNVDGKNLAEPVICQMDVKGGNYAGYCKAEPGSGRLPYGIARTPYKISVSSSHVDSNNRFNNESYIQDFVLAPIPVQDSTKPLLNAATNLMREVDEYVDGILDQAKSGSAAVTVNEPDFEPGYDTTEDYTTTTPPPALPVQAEDDLPF